MTSFIRMAGSTISVAIASMFAGGYLHNETVPHVVNNVDPNDECNFWEPARGRYADADCAYTLVGPRYGRPTDNRYAIERAKRCALRSGDTCIMSHEIDLDVPSALIWDADKVGMRLIAFPRILDAHDERRVVLRQSLSVHPTPSITPTPSTLDPELTDLTDLTERTDSTPRAEMLGTFSMNRTLEVEHTDMNTGRLVRETLEDDDAFCIQLLHRSMPVGCFDDDL
jgi:hypothetical protein